MIVRLAFMLEHSLCVVIVMTEEWTDISNTANL
jgi:hypothetical protein